MELKEVKTITDIKQGDTLIVTGDTLKNEPVKAQIVKVTPNDGTEIIIDKKQNRFFNLGMYLEGKSWVKELKVVISMPMQQQILKLNGLKYSRHYFDDYKCRAQVAIKIGEVTHNLDIYTTDTNRANVQMVLFSRKSKDATSLVIINWTTREQDDIQSKFLDEFLLS